MAGYPSFNAADTAGPEHYRTARIPKTRRTRSGNAVPVLEKGPDGRQRQKFRSISIPCPDLKRAQRSLLWDLYSLPIGATPWSHAYVRGRGVLTNAQVHTNQRSILSIDLQDFFPSISPDRVNRELEFALRRRHNSRRLSPDDKALLDRVERLCFLNNGLPQGSPVSPYLSNLVGAAIDYRMAKLVKGWHRRNKLYRTHDQRLRQPGHYRIDPIRYSRYCDDLTFSSNYQDLWALQFAVIKILRSIGFSVNPDKTRIKTAPARLTVCGVVVNSQTSTPRPRRRALRSRLHRLIHNAHHGRCSKGIEILNNKLVAAPFEQLQGLVAWTDYINKDQGTRLQALLGIAIDVHTRTPDEYEPETKKYLKL
jgi:hypothetical protein